jgi:chemotaxis receptor (MCP) glutamine deamidase CheD
MMSNLVSVGSAPTVVTPQRHVRRLAAGSFALCVGSSLIEAVVSTSVLVVIWDWRHGVAGAVHFGAPHGDDNDKSSLVGFLAIPALLAGIVECGGADLNLQAKIYGGMETPGQGCLGETNAAVAFRVLGEKRIPVLASAIGSPGPLRVMLELPSGQAWVKVF